MSKKSRAVFWENRGPEIYTYLVIASLTGTVLVGPQSSVATLSAITGSLFLPLILVASLMALCHWRYARTLGSSDNEDS